MKKLLLILLFVFTNSGIEAQNYDFDLISVHDLKINESITLGDTKTEVTDLIGNPDNTKLEHWEIRDLMVNEYKYENSSFSFLNDKLESFYIKDPHFVLKYNETTFKVGDSINDLNSVFPTSFNNRSDNSLIVYFGVEINGEMKPSVSFLYIEFNQNNIITAVSSRSR